MKKKHLIEALESFEDEDELMFDGEAWSYVPKITTICGKTEYAMPYYCVLPPNHEGDCYCACKQVYFAPDAEEDVNG